MANSLQELYVEQLQDLYDAEQQLIKALPKMIEAAQSDDLRTALTEHLEVTKTQAERIETICEELDEEPSGEKCKGMAGVIQEGNDHVKDVDNEDVRDALIIASAQRVEHYEMAGYGTARTYANLLGYDQAASLLEESLSEEKEADATLTELSEQLNVEALEAGEEGEKAASAGKSRGEKARAQSGKSGRRKNAA